MSVHRSKIKRQRPYRKAVYCQTNKTLYPTTLDAAFHTKCNLSGVIKCCQGVQFTSNGLKFRYATAEETEAIVPQDKLHLYSRNPVMDGE